MQDHGNALDAHAEGKPAHLREVIRRLFTLGYALFIHAGEHLRIDHAAAEQLDPSRVLAFATPLAAAEDAADLDVGAGLSEWEKAGEKARLHVRSKQRFHGVIERALQVG